MRRDRCSRSDPLEQREIWRRTGSCVKPATTQRTKRRLASASIDAEEEVPQEEAKAARLTSPLMEELKAVEREVEEGVAAVAAAPNRTPDPSVLARAGPLMR